MKLSEKLNVDQDDIIQNVDQDDIIQNVDQDDIIQNLLLKI